MLGKLSSNRTRVFIYTSLLLLCSIPLNFGVISTVTIVFIALNILSIPNLNAFKFNKVYFLLILLYVFALSSLWWSQFPEKTLGTLEKKLSLFLIPFVLFFAPKIEEKSFYKIWKYFAYYLNILFLFFLGVALYRWLYSKDNTEFLYHTLVSPLNLNAIYTSYIVAITLLIYFRKKYKYIIDYLVITGLYIFLILLSSKLVLITTTIVLIYTLLKNKISGLKIFLITLIALAILIFTTPLLNRFKTEVNANYTEILNQEKFGPVYDWKGSTIRLLMMRVGIEILEEQDRYWLGTGVGTSPFYIEENLKSKDLYYDYWNYNFHNQYIQVLVELGIIGLFIYCLVFVLLLYDFRAKELAISIVILLIIWGFTESFVWRQRGLLFYLIIIALLYQTNVRHKELNNEN